MKKLLQKGSAVLAAIGAAGFLGIGLANAQTIMPQSTTAPTASAGTFTRSLTVGDTGQDVMALQQFLNANGYPVALSGPGSAGNETMFFGPLTQAALAQFQASNNIAPAEGFFGPITMSFMTSVMNGSATVTQGSGTVAAPVNMNNQGSGTTGTTNNSTNVTPAPAAAPAPASGGTSGY